MIKVLFFAQIREIIGVETMSVEGDYRTVEELRSALANKGERWALALDADKLMVAVNQTMVSLHHPLVVGDEVAFFPPVTGG